ncbi:hypothetical protein [uncultured Gelidibacter sp.]|uniref:hypothetical protein n=1 Tax=uncultured Gelidibacter sp. TaxID=259318 RepID=UPI0026217079|nr:hypothetical protein [uncultured Gelidibacter sp.]
MDLSLSNNTHFHFVCTNYGSSKDGIGHFTSKIVKALRKTSALKITRYSAETHHLSKLQLFFSMRMTSELLRLKRALQNNSDENYIILEYPFVEYNPLFLVVLYSIKSKKKRKPIIVISLHEYSRTKLFRKLFIKLLIPISDIVLYTKEEDVKPFLNSKTIFKKRIIPANIEPSHRKTITPSTSVHICFFGIINFQTKEITPMIQAWEQYLEKNGDNRIVFHFITSSLHPDIKENKSLKYHFDLDDDEVSTLLHDMHCMILPLKPNISTNNGSLAVCCRHECLPVSVFDTRYFKDDFGLRMKNYSVAEFVTVYETINSLDFETLTSMSELAYQYGKEMSIQNSAKAYLELASL